MRSRVINLTCKIAQQEAERTGKSYKECISRALDEACLRLGINTKEFIKMFI